MNAEELNRQLGNIDLHLLDQVLKGRFKPKSKILDAGCGEGRNLVYFLQNNYEVYAVDQDPSSIKLVGMQSRSLGVSVEDNQFITGDLTSLPFSDHSFDAVLSINVLQHVNQETYDVILSGMVRVLAPGGILFIKMEARDCLPKVAGSTESGESRLPAHLIPSMIADRYKLVLEEPVRMEEIFGEGCRLVMVFRKKIIMHS